MGHVSRRRRGTRASLRGMAVFCSLYRAHRAPATSKGPSSPDPLTQEGHGLLPRQRCGLEMAWAWMPLVGRTQRGALTPGRGGSTHLAAPFHPAWHPVSQHGQLCTLPSPYTTTPLLRPPPSWVLATESPSGRRTSALLLRGDSRSRDTK